ncbi:hypothetical protein DV735_g257, partial [Chaetothyriales sp. CBS 134920]
MDTIASTLTPIRAIAWGELAMSLVGVKTICNVGTTFSLRYSVLTLGKAYMLVVADADLDAAMDLLTRAGFSLASWSYGSARDPRSFTDERIQAIHRKVADDYRNLDTNSVRLEFPPETGVKQRVVLLRSSYTHLSLDSGLMSRFSQLQKMENIYYPDKELLLESFVKTLLREPELGNPWTHELSMWATTYLWGQLMIEDTVLDSCSDEPSVLSQQVPSFSYSMTPNIPDSCSDMRVFSARGSVEPYPGRGGALLVAMCELFEATGVSCDYEDITFPANRTDSGVYCQSAHTGAVNGRAQMSSYISRCPSSRLVLLGYSQGGGIVTDILGGGGGTLFGCQQAANPSLPRETAPGSSVAAVVTFGATRFTANQTYNIGAGSTFNGILPSHGQGLADLNAYADIMAYWCNGGDPICAVGSEPVNVTAHWSYYDEYTAVASRWVVRTVLGDTKSSGGLSLTRPEPGLGFGMLGLLVGLLALC